MKNYVFIALSCVALSGCDDSLSVRDVCDNTPQFCTDLNDDGHCNRERREVIIYRYLENKDPSDDTKFHLLTHFETYSQCIELASQIEHIKLKDKQANRVQGFLTSQRELARLRKETENSNHPDLLYYHFSHMGEQKALEKYLRLEKQGKLDSYRHQINLASYYIKFDTQKTITLLYRALELFGPKDELDLEVVTTLTNLFYQQHQLKQAYVWSEVAKLAGAGNVQNEPLRIELVQQGKSIDALDALANKTWQSITAGEFLSPRE